MPDFGRWSSDGGDPSLNAIARTDKFLDALAAEQPVYSSDNGDAELAYVLAGWRDELREAPTTDVVSQRDAVVALQRAVASRRRTRLSMAVVGSVAAALLCLGGFGAVIAGAGPGDALYGLRTMLFGELHVTRDDQVVLAAQTQLEEVQQLIDQGQWSEAQNKLQAISTTVQTVDDAARKQELQNQWNQLSVKVVNRDPNATLPPNADVPPPAGGPVPAIVGPPTSTSSSGTTTSSSGTTTSSSTSTTTSPPVQQPPPTSSQVPGTTTTSPPTTTTSPPAPPTTTTTTTTSAPAPAPVPVAPAPAPVPVPVAPAPAPVPAPLPAAPAPQGGGESNADQPPTSSAGGPKLRGPEGPATVHTPTTTTTIQLPG
jgi:hypothetical protein